ncbi:Thiazole tautomerase TenI-like domain [uncultured Gammaproteobacteria bacterium]|uniref:Nudix family hydrolase n=1 Tax=Bathymodiolus heckerae thiotrophic gill symbiont TaxID=1052212 RepID=UPI0010B42D12|nr:Nudix family hydrolase [Bathymodiolus heckerae thiotrophic gill symbiont]CAC9436417.1 Thiazole tautomerase TenI-like domain [uncultured Gammaproteobacteria bacterium]CAC9439488.1 Thiazole tautomerase TenI-like domain [uncultured Gammaproteobacteria bacterium]SMN13772.1 Mutator mutT protein (7,8-dihydro-8-oxoguanine-triphosphatase) / Thiamin-phosphate pyrophosphorylase-like protein [Bathymodiolus heckerae thiotrophic gill symbiont]
MKTIKAVVGVLRNKNQEILIAQRQKTQFMGGFWELPGGKIENNESPEQAISRELKEELGIQVTHLNLHQTMAHQYNDRAVELSIYNIEQYQNTPSGVEGQAISWVKIDALNNYKLLPTMKAFINSITLPNKYWITPSSNHQSDEWMEKFNQKLASDITLIQLRSKVALDSVFIAELYNQCRQRNIKLLLNTVNKSFNETYCDGWHLTTYEMLTLNKRPCTEDKLLGVSTHDLDEALKAQQIGVDFVVISPVQATQTHPNTTPLGWDSAIDVADKLNIPVYFLGGMGAKDLAKTLELGAQGIAGVSAF